MSIEVIYSASIENLSDKLIDEIEKKRIDNGPFYSPVIITPNINLRKWISFKYAEKKGISVNLSYKFLEEGLTFCLNNISDDYKTENYVFLSHKENHIYLQLIILSLLLTEGKDEIKYFTEYLGDKNKKNYFTKAWQLSDKLSSYFREYEYHREELIEHWTDNKLFFKNKIMKNKEITDTIEKSEKELYSRIFLTEKFKKIFSELKKKELTTLPQYIKKIFKNKNPKINKKENIYFFALSQISNFHYKLISELTEFFNIKFYTLNYFLNNESLFSDNALLENFAKPQKESLEIFNKLFSTGKNKIKITYPDSIKNKAESTLLKILQNDLTGNSLYDFRKKENATQDETLQIAGFPSLYKEVEGIYNSIVYNLSSDKTLKTTDIAILVNNMDKYYNPLKSVFSRNPVRSFNIVKDINSSQALNYNLSDSNAKKESLFGIYLIKGLECAQSNFSRKELFEFIDNPFFMESQKINKKEIEIFLTWADELNIFYGYNALHKNNFSHYKTDLFTWELGLKRLRFSRIMSNENLKNNVSDFKNITDFQDINSKDSELLNKFNESMESLFELLILMSEKNSLKKWISIINDFIFKFFKIPDDLSDEHKVQIHLIESLKKIEFTDKIIKEKINISFIIELLKRELESLPGKIGTILTEGINISSMMSTRHIPFKIIYLAGLNVSDFPGSNESSILDLRNMEKFPGDVSRSEADNYLFLESILSAKEKLYITYQSKDTEKDENLQPSSLVIKLINHLNEKLLGNDNEYKIFNSPENDPLFSSADDKESHNDKCDLFKNYFYETRLLTLLKFLKDKISDKNFIDIKNKFDLTQETANYKIENIFSGEQKKINLNEIYDFILNPVTAKLKKMLDIFDINDSDLTLKEDENFCTEKFLRNQLISDSFYEILKKQNDLKNEDFSFNDFEKRYHNNYLAGNTPEGIFSFYDKSNILDDINQKAGDDLKIFLLKYKPFDYYEKIIMNDYYKKSKKKLLLSSVKISTGKNTENDNFEISAELENIFIDKKNSILETIIFSNYNFNEKYFIKPILFNLLLLISDNAVITQHTAYNNFIFRINIFFKDKFKMIEINNSEIKHNEVLQYFKKLIEDFLQNKNYDLLPFEIIIKNKELNPFKYDIDQNKYFNKLNESIEDSLNSDFSFLKNRSFLRIINSKVPEDALSKISDRCKYLSMLFKGE